MKYINLSYTQVIITLHKSPILSTSINNSGQPNRTESKRGLEYINMCEVYYIFILCSLDKVMLSQVKDQLKLLKASLLTCACVCVCM